MSCKMARAPQAFLGLVLLLARCTTGLWTSSGDYVRLRLVGLADEKVIVTESQSAFAKVLAVPVKKEVVNCLKNFQSSSTALANRDGGLLDNAPWDASFTKKDAYDALNFGHRRPYEALFSVARKLGQLRESLIEDVWPGLDGYQLEGACRFDSVVECFADEALGLSLVSSCPLLVARDTWDALATDDLRDLAEETKSVTQPQRQPPHLAVRSAKEYQRLSLQGKIDLLLSAGVSRSRFPRPRVMNNDPRGPAALLDDLLLPLCDEIVRRDVLIQRATKDGDRDTATELTNAKSDRHAAYDDAVTASKDGDINAEFNAQYRKNLYDACKADVTQDDGAYSRFLDKDPWYEEQLRRNRRGLEGT